MKILFDTSVRVHSEFLEWVNELQEIEWGEIKQTVPILKGRRKRPSTNPEYERQKEALFTIGRLIREGRITPYTYNELLFERMRGKSSEPLCNALHECHLESCPSPLERSKFRVTINFDESISKGGKKDRRDGKSPGDFNQIAYFQWLNSLTPEDVEVIKRDAHLLKGTPFQLTPFELESLDHLSWFQYLCKQSGSPENYPDVFHIWTAERNGLSAVLTLDQGMVELVNRVRKEKRQTIKINTDVMQPIELLKRLKIKKFDPVPLEHGRLYSVLELYGPKKQQASSRLLDGYRYIKSHKWFSYLLRREK